MASSSTVEEKIWDAFTEQELPTEEPEITVDGPITHLAPTLAPAQIWELGRITVSFPIDGLGETTTESGFSILIPLLRRFTKYSAMFEDT